MFLCIFSSGYQPVKDTKINIASQPKAAKFWLREKLLAKDGIESVCTRPRLDLKRATAGQTRWLVTAKININSWLRMASPHNVGSKHSKHIQAKTQQPSKVVMAITPPEENESFNWFQMEEWMNVQNLT